MLEIKILETIKVVDSYEQALAFIASELRNWLDSNSEIPFTVTVIKNTGLAPPSLNINLGENLRVGGGMA